MSIVSRKQSAARFIEGVAAGAIDDRIAVTEFQIWTATSGDMPTSNYRAAIASLKHVFKTPLTFEPIRMIAEEKCVAVFLRGTGTLVNDAEYSNDYVFFFEFDGDRISAVREYFDTKKVADVLVPVIRVVRQGV